MRNKRPLAFSNEEAATLSKLEYFTAMAMQGACSSTSHIDMLKVSELNRLANASVEIAKATLEALEKEVNNE